MRKIGTFFAIALGGVSQVALAQSTVPAAAGQDAAAPAERVPGGLEEIVVTAQRRAERLQDVPIAVTAVTAEGLERRGVTSTQELAAAVPGLMFNKTPTFVQPYLRGVGSTIGSAGSDPTVPFYIDGVYISAPTALLFSFNNIERIEVLKGPQGTLFGRNATGGLVQIVTRDPTVTPKLEARVGYANYGTVQGSAYVSAGSGSVAADLAVFYRKQSDGWGKNFYKPGDGGPLFVNGVQVAEPSFDTRAGWVEEFGIRSKIVLEASDRTRFKLAGIYSWSEGNQGVYRHQLPGAIGTGPGGTAFNYTYGFYDFVNAVEVGATSKFYLFSAESEHDADFMTIKSITSFQKANAVYTNAGVASNNAFALSRIATFSYQTFTQELQLLSNKGNSPSWLEWILGTYYQNSKAGNPQRTVFGNRILPDQLTTGAQDFESLSGYGQVTASLTDTTRLTVGLRYTSDRLTANQYFVGENPYAANPPAGAAFNFTRLGNVSSIVPEAKKNFSKVTGKIVLDQKLSDDIMTYASFSRGYKAGAFSALQLCLPQTPALQVGQVCRNIAPPVNPEVLDSYELGIKSELFHHSLRLNVAGFYYNYSNLQVQAIVGSPPQTALYNAAAARVYGLEFEGNASLSKELSLNFSASFLDAKYTSFPGAIVYRQRTVSPFGNVSRAMDATGNNLSQAPKFSMNAGFNYVIPMASGDVELSGSVYHNGGFYWEPENRLRENAYTLLSGQIKWQATPQLDVRVWGKNLNGAKYYSLQNASSSGDQGAPAAPRTFGIEIGYKM